jgi:hypothetical protein
MGWLAAAMFGALSATEPPAAFAADGEPMGPMPDFAIRTADGSFREYRDRRVVADDFVKARVRPQGDSIWQLTLTLKRAVREVWFPWPRPTLPNAADAEAVVYYPYRMGVVEKDSAIPSGEWRGETYPGGAFAPLLVTAATATATLIAAVNWPPRQVRPTYTRGRMGLCYAEPASVGERHTYSLMLTTAHGDERRGIYAWQLVLDRYKDWLVDRMRHAGLYPIAYPRSLRRAHGWMQVDLHMLARFRIREIERLFEARHHVFPWLQFWGQMSNYQREPREGLTEWPDPPLNPFEQVGCCLDHPMMHARYRDKLPVFARKVVARGGIVGYYARPRSPYSSIESKDSSDFLFLQGWTETNHRDGANAFYLDVLGARPFGAPLVIARLLSSVLPSMAVIEWPVDVYPSAFLIGGSLWGGPFWSTFPGEELDATNTRMTFPRFGRYLLDDRIIFLGSSNGDFMWWGDYRGWNHWTERQAFLLGAKFDAPTRFKGQHGWIDPLNPVVKRIVAERERVEWWERGPVYRDRAGVTELPDGIDVRRFTDRHGVNLFAVDNPQRRRGLAFRFGSNLIPVPRRPISILVVGLEAG